MSRHGPTHTDGRLTDELRAVLHELPSFTKDVAVLLGRVVRDPRVPRSSKLLALAAVAYAVSPIDVLPDAVLGLGQLDDVWLLARALRRLVRTAGVDVLAEHWTGSDDGFNVVLRLARVAD